MNSLDDFALLRPEHGVATADELAALWPADDVDAPGQAAADQIPDVTTATETPSGRGMSRSRRRRLVLAGTAASLVLGVVAIAAVADRADAPPASVESLAGDSDGATPDDTSPTSGPPSAPTPSDAPTEVGEPPRWGVVADGWTLTAFDDRTEQPTDSLHLFAGPDGVATSWVLVVDGMSPPFLPVDPQAQGRRGDDLFPISMQRVDPVDGNAVVIAGGVSDEQAMAVFRAVRTGGSPPDGFVETDSASAAVRTIRYRFTSEAGDTIEIDVKGAGVPQYDSDRSLATAEEAWDRTDGVDQSNIAYVGEYTLLLRNGFWVTTVVTSADPEDPDAFTRLAELVQVVSAEEWQTVPEGSVAN